MRAVIGSYPGVDFLGETVSIEAPYRALFHHKDALSRHRISQPSCHDDKYAVSTARHIDILLEFLEKTYGDRIREEEARHQRSMPVATWDWLWLLFKPGEVIYKELHNVWVPFVIDQVFQNHCRDGTMRQYEVQCWGVHFCEGKMRRYTRAYNLTEFLGEQSISGLEVIPAAFFPEDLGKQGGLSMADNQIAMGKLYWELSKRPAYKEHDGQVLMKHGDKTVYVSRNFSILPTGAGPALSHLRLFAMNKCTYANIILTSSFLRTLDELSSMQKAMTASVWVLDPTALLKALLRRMIDTCRLHHHYSSPSHSLGRTAGVKPVPKKVMTGLDTLPTSIIWTPGGMRRPEMICTFSCAAPIFRHLSCLIDSGVR